jgi:Reverse transcriptase (RNA-dependent DNA polymerase)
VQKLVHIGGVNKFEKTNFDNCIFVKIYSSGDFIILLIYIDDMLIVGSNLKKIKALKERFGSEFFIKDLSAAR